MPALDEVRPGNVFTRRLRRRGPTWRRVIYTTSDGNVVYATPGGARRRCTLVTFLRWGDRLNRYTPKEGPLL